jgi:hypothetical protein
MYIDSCQGACSCIFRNCFWLGLKLYISLEISTYRIPSTLIYHHAERVIWSRSGFLHAKTGT